MRPRAVPLLLTAVVATLAVPAAAHAAPGDFDLAFNGTGSFAERFDEVAAAQGAALIAVAPTPDGGSVACGRVSDGNNVRLLVVRRRADGKPEPSFADGGQAILQVGEGPSPGTYPNACDVLATPGGGAVVAVAATGPSGDWAHAVLRLRPDGTPDPSFDLDGKRLVQVGEASPLVNAEPEGAAGLVALPDGGLLVSGRSYVAGVARADVLRLDANGATVTAFGDGGVFASSFGPGGAGAVRGTALPDGGSIWALQRTDDDVVRSGAFRLRADGTLDPDFGTEGSTVFDLAAGGLATLLVDVVRQSTGRFVLGGYALTPGNAADALLVALDSGGARDPGFGVDGLVRTTFGDNPVSAHQSLDRQPNDRVLAGINGVGGSTALGGVARYLPDGRPDPSFGDGDGLATQPAPGGRRIVALGLAYDAGRVLLAGIDDAGDGVLARYQADTAPTAALTGPTTAVAGAPVVYDASGSADADGPLAYAWDLDGDGAFDDATGATPSVAFDAAGSRTVAVRVSDDVGQTATAAQDVVVSPAPSPPAVVVPPAVRPPVAASRATLVSKRLSVDSKGRAVVKLRCSAVGSGCAGKLSLRGKLSKRGKTVTLGKRSYRVAAGRTGTVLVTLSKATRRVVRVRSLTGVKLAVTPTGARAATSTVTLRKNRKVKR